MKKYAVIFPGIGYHKDKPLLYYAGKLAQKAGYEIIHIQYHDLPEHVFGSNAALTQATETAYKQAEKQLRSAGISASDDTLLIGKSIGTVLAAKYASEHLPDARQILYTPLLPAFSFARLNADSCIAFLGTADTWSDVSMIRQTCEAQQIPLYLYPACNHSLECSDILRNLVYLREIMQITSDYINQR